MLNKYSTNGERCITQHIGTVQGRFHVNTQKTCFAECDSKTVPHTLLESERSKYGQQMV